jgi:hypothetical protein
LCSRAETAKDLDGLKKVLQELNDHAQRLAAREKWQALPAALQEKADKIAVLPDIDSYKGPQYFLMQLARAAVALMRQKWKQGEDRE